MRIATGKRSAHAVDAFLNEQPFRPVSIDNFVTYDDLNTAYFVQQERARIKRISNQEAIKTFQEVNQGISEDVAIREAEALFQLWYMYYVITA